MIGRREPPADRVFDLWAMLPVHLRRVDVRGDLRDIVACLQIVVDLVLAEGDRWLDILDPRWAPAQYLDLILADLGNPFRFALDVPARRRLAVALVPMYRLKGTAAGVVQVLRFFVGLNVQVVAYPARAARLGRARLGRDFRLGAGDRFHRYAFDVIVDRILTEDERRQVRWLIEYMKPGHTHFLQLREPVPPAPRTPWHLGSGRLAHTTVLAHA